MWILFRGFRDVDFRIFLLHLIHSKALFTRPILQSDFAVRFYNQMQFK